MDLIDTIAIVLGFGCVGYMVYQAMSERNAELQAKIDAEIDRLSR
jgi:homoserine dehydrogenase